MVGKLISYVVILVLISSCDMYTGTTGKVIDQQTGQPISNATVNLNDGLDQAKTNTNGYFEVRSSTGANRVDPEVLINKAGYKPFHIKIKYNSGETSYIIKTESSYIDFDKPIYPDPNNRKTFVTCYSFEKWSQNIKTGDTLIFYLTRDDKKTEIEKFKKDIIKRNRP